MIELLKKRRSIRRFTAQPVAPEWKELILKAALLAPSAKGKRSAEFVVVEDKEVISRLKTYRLNGTMPLETAPLAIVVIGDTRKIDVWVEDASIAATLMQLEAEKLGLGSTWIQLRLREGAQGPTDAAFRNELGIPDHYGVLCVLAVGHPDENKPPYADDALTYAQIHQEKF